MKPTLPEGPRHRNASLSLKVSWYSPRQNETPKRILTTFASVQHKTQGQKITGKEVVRGDHLTSAWTFHSQEIEALHFFVFPELKKMERILSRILIHINQKTA